jgi:hypothetical protein
MNASLTMTDAVKTSLGNIIDMVASGAQPLYRHAGIWTAKVVAGLFFGVS